MSSRGRMRVKANPMQAMMEAKRKAKLEEEARKPKMNAGASLVSVSVSPRCSFSFLPPHCTTAFRCLFHSHRLRGTPLHTTWFGKRLLSGAAPHSVCVTAAAAAAVGFPARGCVALCEDKTVTVRLPLSWCVCVCVCVYSTGGTYAEVRRHGDRHRGQGEESGRRRQQLRVQYPRCEATQKEA